MTWLLALPRDPEFITQDTKTRGGILQVHSDRMNESK